MTMIGRKHEISQLKQLLQSDEAEFLTVVGRRRIGKTYLIREVYKEDIIFEFVGIQYGTLDQQLSNFQYALSQYFEEYQIEQNPLTSWLEAFQHLIKLIEHSSVSCKPVVFIDELPWLATQRSGFIQALSFFWNSWASKSNIVLATCGSAASWMIQKIILNKGGLHNRVSKQIFLQPFTLQESKEYLQSRNIVLNNYQFTQLYMAVGGIPYYLKQIQKGNSVDQIIADLFFGPHAPLKNEFQNLYQSLFNNYEKYIKIIEACYTKWTGINKNTLSEISGISSGGTLTNMLYDLEVSGFIYISDPYEKKKKGSLIRLVDEFSIFYLKFIKGNRNLNWQGMTNTQAYKSWQGYAFENICFKHIDSIKAKLGISGVQTSQHSFVKRGTDSSKGAQIDLLIDRNDQIINLCEIKFYNKPFGITKDYKEKLFNKLEALQQAVSRNKTIHLTLISTFGLMDNKYASIIQSEVTLQDFFKE